MLLYDQVQKLPIRDHNSPPLSILAFYCRQAVAWLNDHPENVVAVHCQGGKGRTGTFCAALLLWTEFCFTANEALDIFARRRTDPHLGRRRRLQGVDSPSQRRCIHYLEMALHNQGLVFPPAPRRTLLTCVNIVSPPFRRSSNGASARIYFIVECCGTVQYDRGKRHGGTPLPDKFQNSASKGKVGGQLRFELEDAAFISGDVTVRFFVFDEDGPSPPHGAEIGPGGRTVRYGNLVGRQLCFISFNTAYHEDGDICFVRSEVDGAYDKSERDFPADFAIIITLNETMGWTCPRLPIPLPARIMSPMETQAVISSTETDGPATSTSKHYIPRNSQSVELTGWSNNTYSAADTSAGPCIPYGLSVGRRLLRLYGAVQEIFSAACPSPINFQRGELMWQDRGYDSGGGESSSSICEGRKLCLIVSGVAEYTPADRGQLPPRINRGDSIARLQLGAGELFGMPNFVLGCDDGETPCCLRAASESVMVRTLQINGSTLNPLSCAGCTTAQLATVLELVAKAASERARDLALHVSRLSIKPTSVKHASESQSGPSAEVRQIIKDLQEAAAHRYVVFRASRYETLLRAAPATLAHAAESGRRGHLLAFADELVFWRKAAALGGGLGGALRASLGGGSALGGGVVKLLYKDIAGISVEGSKLSVHLHTGTREHQCTPLDLSGHGPPTPILSPIAQQSPKPPSPDSRHAAARDRRSGQQGKSLDRLRHTASSFLLRGFGTSNRLARASNEGIFGPSSTLEFPLARTMTLELDSVQACAEMQAAPISVPPP